MALRQHIKKLESDAPTAQAQATESGQAGTQGTNALQKELNALKAMSQEQATKLSAVTSELEIAEIHAQQIGGLKAANKACLLEPVHHK